MRLHQAVPLLALAATALLPREAYAVRPFVTDDARIVDEGQLEVETWPELRFHRGERSLAWNLVTGVTVSPWLEILAGSAIGPNEAGGGLAIGNPVLLPKFLIWRTEEGGIPGLALGTGVTFPVGRGSLEEEASGAFATLITSSRLFEDRLWLHLNLGATAGFFQESLRLEGSPASDVRPYWGVGFDAAPFHDDVRLIGEAFAGDPFEPTSPRIAYQYGVRWLASDPVNLDLTLGTQPAGGGWEHWVQLGVRVVADTFRSTPGNHDGPRGMTRAPGVRRGARP